MASLKVANHTRLSFTFPKTSSINRVRIVFCGSYQSLGGFIPERRFDGFGGLVVIDQTIRVEDDQLTYVDTLGDDRSLLGWTRATKPWRLAWAVARLPSDMLSRNSGVGISLADAETTLPGRIVSAG